MHKALKQQQTSNPNKANQYICTLPVIVTLKIGYKTSVLNKNTSNNNIQPSQSNKTYLQKQIGDGVGYGW